MPGENTGLDIDLVTSNSFITVHTNRNNIHNAT